MDQVEINNTVNYDSEQAVAERLTKIQKALEAVRGVSTPSITVHLPEDPAEAGLCEGCQ